MVKNSLALAFSLGGIVAAVSFRNTLRDTKDAVYIFLAIAVGLAAGIQVMSAAAVMSIIFNIVILIFWYTDFGRAPSHLEGPRAARRLERSLALANRTSAFVAQLDHEILKSLSPEQLQALAAARPAARRAAASRTKRRSLRSRPEAARYAVLRIQTHDPEGARPHIEPILDRAGQGVGVLRARSAIPPAPRCCSTACGSRRASPAERLAASFGRGSAPDVTGGGDQVTDGAR